MSKNSKETQKKADSKRAGLRTRAWACVVYPESLPDNWIEALRETHQEILISPLHDMDVTATGEVKKAHYHVMALWNSPASENQAVLLFERIGYSAAPEMVRNTKGYARYLVHLDDPDKHRYDELEVIELGGVSWFSLADTTEEHEDRLSMEIEDFIDDSGIILYRDLCQYARKNRPDWYRYVKSHSIHFTQYLKSAGYAQRIEP